jgi:hypothetical protein
MNHQPRHTEVIGYHVFAALVLTCIYGYAAVLYFVDLVMLRPTQKTLSPRSVTLDTAQPCSPPEATPSH